jgi:hypothetical protein
MSQASLFEIGAIALLPKPRFHREASSQRADDHQEKFEKLHREI